MRCGGIAGRCGAWGVEGFECVIVQKCSALVRGDGGARLLRDKPFEGMKSHIGYTARSVEEMDVDCGAIGCFHPFL